MGLKIIYGSYNELSILVININIMLLILYCIFMFVKILKILNTYIYFIFAINVKQSLRIM